MRFSLKQLAWRPIPFALVLAYFARPSTIPVDARAQGAQAVVKALERSGMRSSASDVSWVDPRGSSEHPISGDLIVRASTGDNPPALYRMSSRFSPEGVLLDLGTPFKLTRSNGIEELKPIVWGRYAATALVSDGAALSVSLVDLVSEPPAGGPNWTSLMKAQNALTNLQETGSLRGLGRRTFQLVPPARSLEMKFDRDSLVIKGDGKEARIALKSLAPNGGVEQGSEWLHADPFEKGQPPGIVQWSVDRARRISWIGDDTIKVMEAVAFDGLDRVQRVVKSSDENTTAAEIQKDIGREGSTGTVATTDAETGWPPPPFKPYFDKPIPGEGEWELLDKDPFIQVLPGLPAAFARSFIRTDKERPFTRVYIVLWDPRQVEIHPVGGTVEPTSATGTTGSGVIPRTPEVMKRVVAAHNGGFQAMHGEFGMMADGVVYLPPKPFGATVATLRDGSTAFGVWPEDPSIPDYILGYRQNLTPLVLNEQFNPYNRNWWGGTPPGWPDQARTTRSGLCLTKENFVAYYYGNGVDAEALAKAMVNSRCKVGLHLDMNPGHTGLEFYHLMPEAEFKPLGRPHEREYDAEGQVGGIDGWKYLSRKMVHGMGLMHFPRYIQRESRDFFYLSLRYLLPGADLAPVVQPAEPGEGKWVTKGLPQGGFPHAIATTYLRPDATRTDVRARVLAVDPRTVGVTQREGAAVVSFQNTQAPKAGSLVLWLGAGGFAISTDPVPGSVGLLAGNAPKAGGEAKAVVGVRDEDGVLFYVEDMTDSSSANNAAIFDRMLAKMGCSTRLWLSESMHPLLGGSKSMSGAEVAKPSGREIKLVRIQAPGGKQIFEDTPIVPFAVWSPLQLKRIRYFKHTASE